MAFILIEKVLSGTGAAEAITTSYPKVARATIQAKPGNSNVIDVGPSATLAAGKGYRLAPAASDSALTPLKIRATGENNGFSLNSWYVIGTAGEGLNIILETY